MDSFLGEFNILSVSKIANLIVPINIKELKPIILLNIYGTDDPKLYKLFQRIGKGGLYGNSFYEVTITLT